MSTTRNKVESKISAKTREIAEMEDKITILKAEINAMKEVLKILPRDTPSGSQSPEKLLRTGSLAHKAYKALSKRGEALHIEGILIEMKKAVNKSNKRSLSSVLAQYARKNEIFSRPAPNTFGLIEWGELTPDEVAAITEPSMFSRPLKAVNGGTP